MPAATIVAAAGTGTTNGGGANEVVVHDFSPLLLVYRSGLVERTLFLSYDLPGHDPATGVESRDVALSPSTFVRLYLPPEAAARSSSGVDVSDDDGDEKQNHKKATNNKLPVVVFFHGGGFVVGSAGSTAYHRFVNNLTAASPAVVVSVDYRLAPEHMLPAAYEDSLAALTWVLSATDTWLATHGDLGRVFLVGDSAGGNICHHLAMHPDVVKQAAVGRLKGIVLIHPWFWGKKPIGGEQEHRTPWAKHEEGRARGSKKHLWEFVCPGAVDGVDDPRMNPTAPGAPGLEALACDKVMVCVAEGDHLRWRGKAYAEAVAAARAKKKKTAANGGCGGGGQPAAAVEVLESEGVGHVFFLLDPEMEYEPTKELLGRVAAFVRAK